VGAAATAEGDGVTFACCDAWPDDAVEAGVAFDGALEGGAAVPAATRSSLLGGWTVLVVIIAPPANPIAIAANAVPTPTK
jgi:hypothetical protein